MLGNAPLSKYTGVPGWQEPNEEEALIQLARQYVPDENGVIVELGVEYGRSTAQFAYAVKDKKNTRIASVDLFPDDHHFAAQHGGLFAVWQRNLAEYGVSPNVLILPSRGLTWEIGANWNGEIDLLFIDAGHTYEDVKRDIEAWVGHVKAGGIIIFHDYAKNNEAHPLHFEVKRAVDEWYDNRTEKLERIELPDSLIAFKKFEPSQHEISLRKSDAGTNISPVEGSASTDKPEAETRAPKTTTTPKGSKRTGKGIKK